MIPQQTPSDAIYSPLGDDPDLTDLVRLFVDELPYRVDALTGQFEASDWSSLQQAAHQLKGTAGSYGFDAVSPLAAQLERLVLEHGSEEQIREALEDLVECCARVRASQR